MPIKLFLLDHNKIVRQEIHHTLAHNHDISIVGEADSIRLALQLIPKILPDVVIMDIIMPEANGLQAIKQLLSIIPNQKILVYSFYSDKWFVQCSLQAGAKGYLVKSESSVELMKAINCISEGCIYLSPQLKFPA